jgi:hypothetical protein
MGTTPASRRSPGWDPYAAWYQHSIDRLDRLIVIVLVVALAYAYYAVISPALSRERIRALQNATHDLDRLIDQFQHLRDRYSDLVEPQESSSLDTGQATRLFEQNILPAIRGRRETTLSDEERRQLAAVEVSVRTISELYRDHYDKHPRSYIETKAADTALIAQLREYRHAMGILLADQAAPSSEPDVTAQLNATSTLQRLVGGIRLHEAFPSDPVNDLHHLAQLESVIIQLRGFETKSENWSLSEKARLALPDSGGIRLGDTLTQSFSPYAALSEYTDLQEELAFSGSRSVADYQEIQNFIGPTFPVRTISDLKKLNTFAEQELDRAAADARSRVMIIPFTSIALDRLIVLAIVPFLMVVLFHLIASYASSTRRIARKIEAATPISKADLAHFAPGAILRFAFGSRRRDRHTSPGAPRLRLLLALVIRLWFWCIPFVVCAAFVVNAFAFSDRALGPATFAAILSASLLCCVLMYQELAYATRCISS